jgi:hypothetical protein
MSQRFSVQSEMNRIETGLLSDAQREWGESLKWYVFDPQTSDANAIYDVGEERRWRPALIVPCLWVIRMTGDDSYRPEGLSTSDTLQFATTYGVLQDKLGWVTPEFDVRDYLKDRLVYEEKIFTIVSFDVTGRLLNRESIIAGRADQVREDQAIFDPEFAPPRTGSGMGEVLVTPETELETYQD